jgi:SWI/SNF-related matrix-associated actin-dependent regulator 1 of chromatin subfamily A
MLFGPDTLLQAEDRAHRIGQTRPVDVYYVVATGSVEEIIWRLVQKKQVRAVRLLQDRAGSFSADRTHHVDGPTHAAVAPDLTPAVAATAADEDDEAGGLLRLLAEAAPAPAVQDDSDE